MGKFESMKNDNLNLSLKSLRDDMDGLVNEKDRNDQSAPTFYKEMFESLIQNGPVGMYIIEDSAYSYINSRFCDLVGYDKDELISGRATLESIIHPDDLSLVQNNINERLTGEVPNKRYRIRAFKKDGSLIYVELHSSQTVMNDKKVIMGTVIDITEEVTAQINLKENRERFRSLFYNNPDAIFTFDLEGKFTDVNPSCEELSGYTNNELMKMSFAPLIISEDLPIALENFEEAINGVTNNYDITIAQKDGELKHINVTGFPMLIDGKVVGAYGIAKDTTEKTKYKKEIEDLAFYDPITNLPNRNLFEDRLQQVFDLSEGNDYRYAVLFVDLDRFKFINDSLGHHLGDEFLKNIAKRLKDNLRKTDTVGRFAGDEFAILLPNTSEEDAIELAEGLNKAIVEPFDIMGHSVSVSASIGIAFSDSNVESPEELIKNADTAMYYTKKYGKNNHTVYSRELDLNATYKLTIERDLKTALSNQELMLHYQPIVNLETGEFSAMEALLRWNHPELGYIPPDKFIPISEESGQIVSIGKWVLHMACSQNKKWQELGHSPFKISVNISTIQLQHQSFIEVIKEVLEETGLDAKWLELEVTESILMENSESLKRILFQLKEIGVSISIDDFGTGYTSLSYLREFSFDRVKIDRSFIKDINSDLNGKAITSTIISLAHKLKLGVIAEGIEDEVQLSFLKEEFCDEGQGYYFCHPLPAELHQLPNPTGKVRGT
ncbi:sensor domain-containing protein [Aquibacillus saliphilus]|uniref:sensor domain-containing protein n=1 Tax=Aquibacillus saliphilus TaxID=1909422 RepID=UPI001CF054BA|nr:EAL domain-containing protein [Aquibacillus saliphilus]